MIRETIENHQTGDVAFSDPTGDTVAALAAAPFEVDSRAPPQTIKLLLVVLPSDDHHWATERAEFRKSH